MRCVGNVKSDSVFSGKKVEFIELAYLDEINSFCWLIKEKLALPTKLGTEEYSLDIYYVNAYSGKLEKKVFEKGVRIACGGTRITTRKP